MMHTAPCVHGGSGGWAVTSVFLLLFHRPQHPSSSGRRQDFLHMGPRLPGHDLVANRPDIRLSSCRPKALCFLELSAEETLQVLP